MHLVLKHYKFSYFLIFCLILSACQMWLQVMERILTLLNALYFHQTFANYIFNLVSILFKIFWNISMPNVTTGYAILSIVFCHLSTKAYTSLCRGLKFLLKVGYIIPNHPNVARFLIFDTFCLGRSKTLTYVCKNITKMNDICFW